MKLAVSLAPTIYLAAFLVAPGAVVFATIASFVMGFALLVGALASRDLCR